MATEVQTRDQFRKELEARQSELANILPSTITVAQFMDVAITAAKANPALLLANRHSLHIACTNAARDGLLPDGKEGVIVIRRVKTGDAWTDAAGWQPMVYGVRKRARELDGIIIDAQVVHENDRFVWRQGDDPSIEHEPLLPWKGERGPMVAAFAIVRRGGEVLHREVMDASAIATVRSKSKMPNSAMWTEFASEGWKKTVVHRAMKSCPVSDKLRTIIDRHNDDFDLSRRGPPMVAETTGAPLPPPPPEIARPRSPLPPPPPPLEVPPPPPQAAPDETPMGEGHQREFVKQTEEMLADAGTIAELTEVWESRADMLPRLHRRHATAARAAYAKHMNRLEAGRRRQPGPGQEARP